MEDEKGIMRNYMKLLHTNLEIGELNLWRIEKEKRYTSCNYCSMFGMFEKDIPSSESKVTPPFIPLFMEVDYIPGGFSLAGFLVAINRSTGLKMSL